MDSYLRLFSLRLLIQEESFNANDINYRDLLQYARSLKSDIRNTRDILKIFSLNQLIFENIDKEKLFKAILEDDFIFWVIESIGNSDITGDLNDYTKAILSFITFGLNVNFRFILKLVSNTKTLQSITNLTRMDNLDNFSKMKLLFIISTITFQYDETLFRNNDVKNFLLRQVNGEGGHMCIGTLIKIFSYNYNESSQAQICSFIPKIVQSVENCCRSPWFTSGVVTMDVNLSNLKEFCKLRAAKKQLSENFKLFFALRHILKDIRFHIYVPSLMGVLTQLYTAEQINQMENDTSPWSI